MRSRDGYFDAAVGCLARDLGETEMAEVVEQRSAFRSEMEQVTIDAVVLDSLAKSWDPADPYLCNELIRVTSRLKELGLTEPAVSTGRSAVRLARENPRPSPATLACALYELGTASHNHNVGEAIKYLTEALELQRTLYRYQSGATDKQSLASTLYTLGGAHNLAGNTSEAIRSLTAALGYDEELYSARPTVERRRRLSMVHCELGLAYRLDGDLTTAVLQLQEALQHDIAVYAAEATATHRRELAITLGYLGDLHVQTRDLGAAVARLSESVGHDQALFDQQPSATHRAGLAASLHRLGRAHRMDGDFPAARARLLGLLGSAVVET